MRCNELIFRQNSSYSVEINHAHVFICNRKAYIKMGKGRTQNKNKKNNNYLKTLRRMVEKSTANMENARCVVAATHIRNDFALAETRPRYKQRIFNLIPCRIFSGMRYSRLNGVPVQFNEHRDREKKRFVVATAKCENFSPFSICLCECVYFCFCFYFKLKLRAPF